MIKESQCKLRAHGHNSCYLQSKRQLRELKNKQDARLEVGVVKFRTRIECKYAVYVRQYVIVRL